MENKKFNPVWILVVLVVLFFAYNMRKVPTATNTSSDAVQHTQENTAPTDSMESTSEPTESMIATDTKEFTVSAENFSYDVKEIKVKKGDTVKITFKNVEGSHDWNLDEFKAKQKF